MCDRVSEEGVRGQAKGQEGQPKRTWSLVCTWMTTIWSIYILVQTQKSGIACLSSSEGPQGQTATVYTGTQYWVFFWLCIHRRTQCTSACFQHSCVHFFVLHPLTSSAHAPKSTIIPMQWVSIWLHFPYTMTFAILTHPQYHEYQCRMDRCSAYRTVYRLPMNVQNTCSLTLWYTP